ncbi:hypothetical protein BC833DRAFT_571419 [Globomyces pollinis-pini]|nr:hypothetical protein BC833DRAFT_571419 [Globomyces pollinis-pini]
MQTVSHQQPAKSIIFLSPTNALVIQQSKSITNYTDLTTCDCSTVGLSIMNWTLKDWLNQLSKYQVLVMTPQLLLNLLHHSYLNLANDISLLIFDECHHAMKIHPYRTIMEGFYHKIEPKTSKPKVLGLTASPIFQGVITVDESYQNMLKLQKLLDSKIITILDQSKLVGYSQKVQEIFVEYSDSVSSNSNPNEQTNCKMFLNYYLEKLLKHLVKTLKGAQTTGPFTIREARDVISKMGKDSNLLPTKSLLKEIENINTMDSELGSWCAGYTAQSLWRSLENNTVYDKETEIMILPTAEDITKTDVSAKLWTLIRIMKQYRINEELNVNLFRTMIFVDRRSYAATICKFLNHTRHLHFTTLSCGYATGSNTTSHKTFPQGTKSNRIFEEFRTGDLNTLIVTRVAEEGIDIPNCRLVVLFDLFRSNVGYVQTRGRARDVHDSKYIILVKKGNLKALKQITDAKVAESVTKRLAKEMMSKCTELMAVPNFYRHENDDSLIDIISSDNNIVRTSKGATITEFGAVQLVHWYSSSMHKGGFKPVYDIVWHPKSNDSEAWRRIVDRWTEQSKAGLMDTKEVRTLISGFSSDGPTFGHIYSCTIFINDQPITVLGLMKTTRKMAKSNAALFMCWYLYKQKHLNDHLLPKEKFERLERKREAIRTQSDRAFTDSSTISPQNVPNAFGSLTNVSNIFITVLLIQQDDASMATTFKTNVLALGTKYPLPTGDIMQIPLWMHNQQYSTKCIPFSESAIALSPEQLVVLSDYQKVLMKSCFKRTLGESKTVNNTEPDYYLIPVNMKLDRWEIDWHHMTFALDNTVKPKLLSLINYLTHTITTQKFVDGSLNYHINEMKQFPDTHKADQSLLNIDQTAILNSILSDIVVFTPHNDFRYYLLKFSNNTAKSTFNKKRGDKKLALTYLDYFENLGYTISEPNSFAVEGKPVPLLKNRRIQKEETTMNEDDENCRRVILLLEACNVLPFNGKYLTLVHLFPSLYHQIQLHCLVDDFFTQTGFPKIPHHMILPAFCAPNANEGYDYERLETMGDAFLKYAVTVSIYHQQNNISEHELSNNRGRAISNQNLYSIGMDKKLDGFLNINGFVWQLWKFPNETNPDSCSGGVFDRKWSKKMLADFLEAIIGAYWMATGHDSTLSILRMLGIISEPSNMSRHIPPYKSGFGDIDDNVQKFLNFRFNDPKLLIQSLTHSSVSTSSNYERLEFLGDAILDFFIIDYTYRQYPDATPAMLSLLRQAAVNNDSFCRMTHYLGIYKYIRLQSQGLQSQIEVYINYLNTMPPLSDPYESILEGPKILGDVFESVVGAIYLDSCCSFETVQQVIYPLWRPFLDLYVTPSTVKMNPIRKLLEYLQSEGFTSSDIEYKYSTLEGLYECRLYLLGHFIIKAEGNSQHSSKYNVCKEGIQWFHQSDQVMKLLKGCNSP